jgi:hypothetical protein
MNEEGPSVEKCPIEPIRSGSFRQFKKIFENIAQIALTHFSVAGTSRPPFSNSKKTQFDFAGHRSRHLRTVFMACFQ